ncbi:MAG: NAD(P)-binding domain-containing protein, partial [Anaerolineales bacterium]|nr:NAD(P)-binding domain-containing protein [Anaerolineales bacterium]
MDIGMVGLGKMGGNMARRLSRNGHRVVGYTRSFSNAEQIAAEEENVLAARSLEQLVSELPAPRAVWLMVPAGEITENSVRMMLALLDSGDILIDGGNSNYKDTVRRGAMAADAGVHFVDVGTSGGIWGLKEGYSMMI